MHDHFDPIEFKKDRIAFKDNIKLLKQDVHNTLASLAQPVKDVKQKATQAITESKNNATTYVQQHPIKTIAIAVAIGFLSGKIIRLSRFSTQ